MKLKDYLKVNKITNKTFANILKVSPVSLSRYLNGDRLPEKETLIKIYNLTEGFVSPNDFCLQGEKEYEVNENEKEELKKFHHFILSGSRKYLGKAITLIESSREKDQITSERLLELFNGNNKSIRIGITGVPGVGKSTFIETLGGHLINHSHSVAVLTVDPSSVVSGGSILGDKTRMPTLAVNQRAFIRPSPAQGVLGGVQADVAETVGPGDVDVADRAARQAVVEDAQVGQDVQRGAVDDQGSIVVARLVVGAAVYRLDDRHVESGAGQADGQRCAGHPAAGDDDVVLVFGVHDC